MLPRYESLLDLTIPQWSSLWVPTEEDIDVPIEGSLGFVRDTMVLDPAEHSEAPLLADGEAAFANGLDVVGLDAAEFDEFLGIAAADDRKVNPLAGSAPDASTDSVHAARQARP